MTLKDVRHIPDLRMNLIAVNALDQEGFYSFLGGGKWKLTKGSMVVAKGSLSHTLYRTQLKVLKEGMNAVEDDASPDLWHRRLVHMSEK